MGGAGLQAIRFARARTGPSPTTSSPGGDDPPRKRQIDHVSPANRTILSSPRNLPENSERGEQEDVHDVSGGARARNSPLILQNGINPQRGDATVRGDAHSYSEREGVARPIPQQPRRTNLYSIDRGIDRDTPRGKKRRVSHLAVSMLERLPVNLSQLTGQVQEMREDFESRCIRMNEAILETKMVLSTVLQLLAADIEPTHN